MVFNQGGTELFYDRVGNPLTINARTAFDLPYDQVPGTPTLVKMESCDEIVTESVKRVSFIRKVAMGDLLMLLPVAREFKKRYPWVRLDLITNFDPLRGIEILRMLNDGVFDSFSADAVINPKSYDVAFFMNGLVERDLYLPKYNAMHRIDIYREFFGLPQDVEPEWASEPPLVGTEGIVFCWQGSKDLKTLPVETKNYLTERLKVFDQPVILVDELRKLGPKELVEASRRAVAMISMDSGPLWVAHHTRTPVVLIHGPSRPKERLGYHPLRPEGVAGVDLAALIGCSPCFERLTACNSKCDCMKAPKEEIWKLLQPAVRSVRWKTR